MVLNLKKEVILKQIKDFQDGDYQWADEPDQIIFPMQNNKILEKTPIINKNSETRQNKKNKIKKEKSKEKKISLIEMKKILKKKHNEELLRRRKLLELNPPKIKKENIVESFMDVSDKYLKKEINLNRDILLYKKKWLFDREYKFFFSSVYYQNILATDLSWREDYKHLLFVRLMSYHNIGKLFYIF